MSFMTPENTEAFRAESRADEIHKIHLLFFVFSITSVLARLAAVRVSGRRFAWDDGLAIASLVFTIGVFIGTMFWLRFGLGRHKAVVQEEDPNSIFNFYKTIFATEILYPLGLASARLSLVVLYHRVFGLFNARYYLHGIMAFILAWSIYATFPLIFACKPVSNFWTTHENCIDISKTYIGIAVGSIITDFVLILLPLPYAAQLRMPFYKKILLLMSFLFGGFNCFVTIIRLVKVTTFDYEDPTWGSVDLIIWTGLEAYCAVICCCLPTLRPLFRYQRAGERTPNCSRNKDKVSEPDTQRTLPTAMDEGHELDDRSTTTTKTPSRAEHLTLENQLNDVELGTTTLDDPRRYGRDSSLGDARYHAP